MADSSQSLDSAKTRDEEDEATNRRSLSSAMFVVPKKKQKVIPLYEANRVDTDTLVMQFSPPMLKEKCDPKEAAVPIQKQQQQREPSNGIRSKERHSSSSSSIGASAASAMRSLKSAARAAISVLSPVVETPATPAAMSPQKTHMPVSTTNTNLLMSPILTRQKATPEALETNSKNDEVSRMGDLDNNEGSDDEEVDALVLRMQSPKGRGGQRRQRKRIQRQYAASLRGDNMIFRTQTAPTPQPSSAQPVHEQPKKRKLPAKVSP